MILNPVKCHYIGIGVNPLQSSVTYLYLLKTDVDIPPDVFTGYR